MTVANILTTGSGEYEELFFCTIQQCLPGHFSCLLMDDHTPINID